MSLNCCHVNQVSFNIEIERKLCRDQEYGGIDNIIIDSSPPSPASDDVGSLTAELVEKLEHFKVGQEKVSSVKNIAIKLEALYSAWTAGALTLSYIQTFLQNARSKITEAEGSLASHPWRPVWDRLVPLQYLLFVSLPSPL